MCTWVRTLVRWVRVAWLVTRSVAVAEAGTLVYQYNSSSFGLTSVLEKIVVNKEGFVCGQHLAQHCEHRDDVILENERVATECPIIRPRFDTICGAELVPQAIGRLPLALTLAPRWLAALLLEIAAGHQFD